MNVITRKFKRPETDAMEYLQELEAEDLGVGDYEARMQQPFLTRIVKPLGERGRKAARYVAWSRFVGQSFDGAHAGWRLNRWFGWQWNKVPPVRRAAAGRPA